MTRMAHYYTSIVKLQPKISETSTSDSYPLLRGLHCVEFGRKLAILRCKLFRKWITYPISILDVSQYLNDFHSMRTKRLNEGCNADTINISHTIGGDLSKVLLVKNTDAHRLTVLDLLLEAGPQSPEFFQREIC